MQLERVQVAHVDIPSRLRAVDATKVKQLSESIDAIGLQTPITLHQGSPDQEGFELVAGAHRLEAVRLLGWEWVDAFFMEGDDIDRQIWEIDENLMRSELTATQMAEHLAKRKELWGMKKESGNTVPTFATGRGNTQFASETADASGVSKRMVNKAVSRAEGVTEAVRDEIRGTDLDKGVVLDDLKKVEPDQQMARLRQIQKDQSNRSKIDADVKDRAAKEVAEIIAEHVPGEWWDAIKANLYSAGARNIADQFSNITGEAVMDRRYGK